MENEKQSITYRESFDELCDLVDSINWYRAPYRGVMQELAALEGVTVGAISNAAKIHRNERIIYRLFEIVERREADARRVIEQVCGNVDLLWDALKSGKLNARLEVSK